MVSSVQAAVLNDFEGYVDSAAMNADVLEVTANAAATLESTGGVGGSKAMKVSGHNGQDPWFTVVRLDFADFNLSDVALVSCRVKFPSGGTMEQFKVELVDAAGVIAASGPTISTTDISTDDFDLYSIDVELLNDATITAVNLVFQAVSYGQTAVIVDDLQSSADPIVPAFNILPIDLKSMPIQLHCRRI